MSKEGDGSSNSSDGDSDVEMAEEQMNGENGGEEEEEIDMEELEKIDDNIAAMKAQLESDPTDYDATLRLLRLLRLNGDVDELACVREAAVALFPLPGKEWLNWIEDTKGTGSREDVEILFRRALADNPCEKLWTEFALWACGGPADKCREVFDDALTACGLRVDVGGQLWLARIHFEEALVAVEGEQASKRLAALYAKSLRVPNIHLATIWEKYCKFTGDSPDAAAAAAHKTSQKMLAELAPFEEALEEADNSIQSLYAYLEWELERNDPARVQSFYERILEQHPTEETIWVDYASYLEQTIKIPTLSIPVLERAVRQCPSSCALWQPLLLAEEKAKVPLDKIEKLWAAARLNLRSPEEGRALYRTFIYLLRRRTDASGEKDYNKIAEVFEDGSKVLAECFGLQWDLGADYRRMQAFFYFDRLKDIERGRRVWEDILASGGGRLAERWLEAIRLERQYGEISRTRKLFYKAVNSVSDHPQIIFHAFVQFEREEGTLDELDKALDKVNSQAARRAVIAPAKEKATGGGEKGKGREGRKDGKEQQRGKKRENTEKVSEAEWKRRKAEEQPRKPQPKPSPPKVIDKDGFTMPTMPAPKAAVKKTTAGADSEGPSSLSNSLSPSAASPHNGDRPSDESKFTIFVSNLDFKATADEIKEVLDGVVEVRLLYRGMSKLHKGYGYVDMESDAALKAALAQDRVQIKGRPMYISENLQEKEKRVGFKFGTGLERNKLFVKNIHYDATPEQITEVFSAFGPVREVRIVTHKSGKAKGVAYVDMETAEAAASACAAEEVILLERTLGVLLSNPPKKSEVASASTFSSSRRDAPPPVGGRIGHSSMISLVPRNISVKPADSGPSTQATPSASKMSNDQFRQFLARK